MNLIKEFWEDLITKKVPLYIEVLIGWLNSLSDLMLPHISLIVTTIITCIIVALDGYLRHTFKRMIHFFYLPFRIVAFILMLSIGYTLIINGLLPYGIKLLFLMKGPYLPVFVFCILTILGILLERQSGFSENVKKVVKKR
ncbi:MAG: DUF3392 family protein [Spirochaetia bacterium]|nr:DUF3392 family protein [Spirochaetia bacterium]